MADQKTSPSTSQIPESAQWTPRLQSSKKWTSLPADFVAKVQKVFADQFDIEADNGTFIIEGAIYPEEMIVRAGYAEEGRLKQINFEASIDLPPGDAPSADENEESATMKRLYICIDALGSLMEEYFNAGEDDEMDIPFLWRPYKFEGETIYLQHSTFNSRLEAEANRLLGLAGVALFEETESEDALANATIDTDLAKDVQKLIREGKFPRQHEYVSEDVPDLASEFASAQGAGSHSNDEPNGKDH